MCTCTPAPPRPAPRSQDSLGIRPLNPAWTWAGSGLPAPKDTPPSSLRKTVSSPTVFGGIIPLFREEEYDSEGPESYTSEPQELSEAATKSSTDVDDSSEARRSISTVYYRYVQRSLSTVILAGTFMAGVEAQLLSLIISAPDTNLRSLAVSFAVFALLATAFVALYAAVTYMWLRQDWKHKDHCFDEWVTGSLTMMTRWCWVFLVLGVYAGFVAVLLFLYAAAPHAVAVFAVVIFFLCGVGPMTWGLYHYCGLRFGWLEWSPGPPLLKFRPRRRQTSPV